MYDYKKIKYDIDILKNKILEDISIRDERKTLYQITLLTNCLFYLGWVLIGFNYLFLNVLGSLLFSLYITSNWSIIAHHTLHRGFDQIKDDKYHSKIFARGWMRMIHWPDWLHPPSWCDEHNKNHHYFTGEMKDPDLVEENNQFLRNLEIPLFLKYILMIFIIMTWRFTYYCHNIIICRYYSIRGEHYEAGLSNNKDYINNYIKCIPQIILNAYLPYFFFIFIVIPSPFILVGTFYKAMFFSILAEIIANIHTFIIIVTNHAGSDVYRFTTSVQAGSGDFYMRALLGSVNFKTGGFINDFLHGYLNYQIEHHMFPNESPLFYKKFQPVLKRYCIANDLPYIQESVFIRLRKTINIMTGVESMKVYN